MEQSDYLLELEQLLEENERKLELAGHFGQSLLEKNNQFTEQVLFLTLNG